jgi:hypothetical protein
MLGFYYFVGDCPDSAKQVPAGMLSAGNTIFVSFVTQSFTQLDQDIVDAIEQIKRMI